MFDDSTAAPAARLSRAAEDRIKRLLDTARVGRADVAFLSFLAALLAEELTEQEQTVQVVACAA